MRVASKAFTMSVLVSFLFLFNVITLDIVYSFSTIAVMKTE